MSHSAEILGKFHWADRNKVVVFLAFRILAEVAFHGQDPVSPWEL
jgi:hypothetical protein